MPTVLFVVGDDTSPDADDANLKTTLEGLGWTVTYADDDDTDLNTQMASYDVTLVSDTCVGSKINDDMYDQSYPLVTYESGVLDNWNFTSGGSTRLPAGGGITDIDILDNTHYVTSPFSLGLVTYLNSSRRNYYNDTTWGSGADLLGAVDGASTQILLATYDTGATMASGTAPERRGYYAIQGNSPSDLTTDGETIIDRMLTWAAGLDSPGADPKTATQSLSISPIKSFTYGKRINL